MIVTHNQNKLNQSANTPSTGVIIGWHQYADRHNVEFSDNNILNPVLPLNIYTDIKNTKEQANYLILTEQNEICYVAEGMNISLETHLYVK